jgi:hypothetical protein
MFTVSSQDLSDLLAAIDLGWAKEVKGASFFDEADHFIRFFHIDGRLFREDYNDGSATWLEVCGEDLLTFGCYHPEVSA